VGVLFNLLVYYPLRSVLRRENARWQERKSAGERVLPLKPSTLFLLVLAVGTYLALLIF
jgi:hypothetical protein